MTQTQGVEVRARASSSSRAAPEDVYDVISDLPSHLVWAGERAPDPAFKLLTLEAPEGAAEAGATFSSPGANYNGTFQNRSVVTEAARPHVFVIETDSRLERRHGEPWEARFVHRYDVEPEGAAHASPAARRCDR